MEYFSIKQTWHWYKKKKKNELYNMYKYDKNGYITFVVDDFFQHGWQFSVFWLI